MTLNYYRVDWGIPDLVCKCCGKKLPVKRRLKYFCSIKCQEKQKVLDKEFLDMTNHARNIIFERDDFTCVYCGASPIEDTKTRLAIDHIVPYHLTMNNNIYNLVTACCDCNMTKGIKILRPDVYKRIIKRNIERTNGRLTKQSIAFVNEILHEYFKKTKAYFYEEFTFTKV